jgi:hypothetical protein
MQPNSESCRVPPAPASTDEPVVLTRGDGRTLPAVVLVAENGKPDVYLVAALPCDQAGHQFFELIGYRPKDAGYESGVRRYHTMVAEPTADRPAAGLCDCACGTYGHRAGSDRTPTGKPCRHVRFLSALWSRGELPCLPQPKRSAR